MIPQCKADRRSTYIGQPLLWRLTVALLKAAFSSGRNSATQRPIGKISLKVHCEHLKKTAEFFKERRGIKVALYTSQPLVLAIKQETPCYAVFSAVLGAVSGLR